MLTNKGEHKKDNRGSWTWRTGRDMFTFSDMQLLVLGSHLQVGNVPILNVIASFVALSH